MKDTFDVAECADFLKISENRLIEKARKGLVPGAKIGKCWVFLRSDMIAYLRKEVARQQMLRREKQLVEEEMGPAPSVVPQRPSTEELVRMANELCGDKD